MDLLLSLPVASYLLAPSLTSWSTSLNLLFFYMTWTTLVLSHPPLRVHIVVLLAIRLFFSLVPALLSLLVDAGLPSLAEGLKHGGRASLPAMSRSGGARGLVRLVALAVFNLVAVVTGAEALASWAFASATGAPEFPVSTTLPLPWQMARHILIILTAREVLTYYIHRFVLHGENNAVSRLHLAYAHARAAAPFSLQLWTDHPIPLLLHRFVPLYLPALFLRPHILTYFVAVALCTLEETLSMSGYSIIPGIIMGGIVRRSAVHYATRGRANYGAWGLLDWFHGTGQGRDVLDDLRDEAVKHRVKERSTAKAERGAGRLKKGIESLTAGDGETAGPRRSPRKRTPRQKD